MAGQRFKAPVAVHLFLLRDDLVLLLRRQNTGYEDGNYSVIAGHLDGDEEIATAMAREAGEEAGISIDPADLTFAGVMHRRSNDERIDFFLTARRWHGEVTNAEPEKCGELAWFPLNALPPNIIPYVRAGLTAWRQGRWFTSFGWNNSE